MIPGVLYGPKIKPGALKVDAKAFQKVYDQAGRSSLILLESPQGSAPVLIKEIQRDPVKGTIVHADFYQPPLDEKIQATVPLVFEGEAPAVRDLGGTLLRNIQEVEVKALPQHLPHEITVEVSKLVSFEDRILARDLVRDEHVEILRDPDEVVAQVVAPEDVEAELEKPVEEKVEAVEVVKEEKKKEEELEAEGQLAADPKKQ